MDRVALVLCKEPEANVSKPSVFMKLRNGPKAPDKFKSRIFLVYAS